MKISVRIIVQLTDLESNFMSWRRDSDVIYLCAFGMTSDRLLRHILKPRPRRRGGWCYRYPLQKVSVAGELQMMLQLLDLSYCFSFTALAVIELEVSSLRCFQQGPLAFRSNDQIERSPIGPTISNFPERAPKRVKFWILNFDVIYLLGIWFKIKTTASLRLPPCPNGVEENTLINNQFPELLQ